jgi:hypothetical protein
MIALRPFRYAGKKLKPGSRFDISKRKDVQILSTLGSAKEFVPEPGEESKQEKPERPNEPEEITTSVRKPRQRYRRRDMKAEDV